jgi:RNA polymerase sigma factor (sigma-70 family)
MTRDEQILSLRRVVLALAGSLQLQYGGEIEDLISDGWVGAIQAVDRYDPQNAPGASLATFAKHRIRGAILDGLRARDYVPVSVRRNANAGHILAPEQPLSLEQDLSPEICFVDEAATTAVDLLLGELDLSVHLSQLPKRQVSVLRARYWAGRSQAAIAADMRLSQARVSQLLTEARDHLRKGLVGSGSMTA